MFTRRRVIDIGYRSLPEPLGIYRTLLWLKKVFFAVFSRRVKSCKFSIDFYIYFVTLNSYFLWFVVS